MRFTAAAALAISFLAGVRATDRECDSDVLLGVLGCGNLDEASSYCSSYFPTVTKVISTTTPVVYVALIFYRRPSPSD
jgi:hypothetical protein